MMLNEAYSNTYPVMPMALTAVKDVYSNLANKRYFNTMLSNA